MMSAPVTLAAPHSGECHSYGLLSMPFSFVKCKMKKPITWRRYSFSYYYCYRFGTSGYVRFVRSRHVVRSLWHLGSQIMEYWIRTGNQYSRCAYARATGANTIFTSTAPMRRKRKRKHISICCVSPHFFQCFFLVWLFFRRLLFVNPYCFWQIEIISFFVCWGKVRGRSTVVGCGRLRCGILGAAKLSGTAAPRDRIGPMQCIFMKITWFVCAKNMSIDSSRPSESW